LTLLDNLSGSLTSRNTQNPFEELGDCSTALFSHRSLAIQNLFRRISVRLNELRRTR
jgi:hypothetical protein